MNLLLRSALALGSIAGARKAAKYFHKIDLDDALQYVGLERRTTTWPTIALAAVGAAALGAGAALLFTPASGPELRARLTNRLEDAKEKLAHMKNGEGKKLSHMIG